MMSNPKTTILGYLVLAGAVIHVAVQALKGDYSNLGLADVLAALSGLGLVVAKDGNH